ncbi:MAG: TRAP transporter small permease [Alphaproteobacteria bacterium]|nr:TRAP transporter small permease [Alphaproteobacteria bacterium]
MKGALDAVEQALGAIERAFLFLANVCLGLMLLFNAVNIFWRGIFDISITFVWPWTLLLFVWMTFFAFFVIYRRAKDITVEYFVELLGPKALHATRLFSDALIIALMTLMVVEAPRTLSSQVGDMELIPLQRYWMSVPLFLSVLLILVHFVVDLFRALAGAPERRHVASVPE